MEQGLRAGVREWEEAWAEAAAAEEWAETAKAQAREEAAFALPAVQKLPIRQALLVPQ
jgi:hypothetical protein